MASRGWLRWFQKEFRLYVSLWLKITVFLIWIKTSVNSFLMGLWPQLLVSSPLQYSVLLIMYIMAPLKSEKMAYRVINVLIMSKISTNTHTKRNQILMLEICCLCIAVIDCSYRLCDSMQWFCFQAFIASRCFVCFVYLHLLIQFIWVFLREQIKGRCVFFFSFLFFGSVLKLF